ncbi:MFS transporter [Endozoicomonas sp. 4G]|uniref:MFS transporter n=1 Tax=Endozoicomonas sp. 4G TaxID=2872754 RepID=UPI0020787C03|nr:MFS transporter [Endozoicomonas sp. 4G]
MSDQDTFSHEQRWVIVSLILGAIMPLIDATALGVAIPNLAKSFEVNISKLQWVSVLYTITATMTVTLCAWATRRLGAKRLWLTGLFVFTASSLIAAISPNINMLLLSRGLQGVGAGIIMTGMQTVLVLSVGKPLLKTAMATMAVPTVLAPIAGPVVAGLLLHIGDWRWIFYINIPIGLMAFYLAVIKLPDNQERTPSKFDVGGFLFLAPALTLLVLSLSSLSDISTLKENTWLTAAFSFTLGALLLCVFLLHARQVGEKSLIQITSFRSYSFRSSMILLLLSSTGFYAGMFGLPVLFIQELGRSEWIVSLWIGAQGVGALVSRSYLKKMCDRWGVGFTGIMGVLLSVVGTLPLLIPDLYNHCILTSLSLLIRGAGIGLSTLLAMSHAFHELTPQQTPDASVLSRIFTLLGASFGPAGIVILYSLKWQFSSLEWVISGLSLLALACIWPTLKLLKAERRTTTRTVSSA